MQTRSTTLTFAVGLLVAFTALADKGSDDAEFRQVYGDYKKHVTEKDYDSSLPFAKRALELGEILFEPSHANLPALTYNYGFNLNKLKRYKEAKPVMKTAVRRYQALYGKGSEKLIPVLMDLGHASIKVRESGAQKAAYRRALRLVETHHGRNSVLYGQRSLDAGTYLLEQAKTPDAKRFLEDALEVLTQQLGVEHPTTGLAAFYLGKFNLGMKHREKARDNLLLALNSFEHPDRPSSSLELTTHAFLVQVYEGLKESSEATKHCLAIGRMSPARDSQDYQPLFRMIPTYPVSAQQKGMEGNVVVEFTVDEGGFVKDISVDKSTHRSFEQSALEAVEKWRFAPRFEDGMAVSTAGIRTRLSFALE